MDTVKNDLAQILDRVESRAADGYGKMSFRAKAVGKSADSIHLAVATGIISVPLTEITSITAVRGLSDLEFQVDVRNGDRITYLRQVPVRTTHPVNPNDFPDYPPEWPPRVPPRGGDPNPDDPFGFPIFGQDGGATTTTSEDDGIDTSTTSGLMAESADKTDDHRPYHKGDTD